MRGALGWSSPRFSSGTPSFSIPGGVIADRWSARRLLALAFFGFSFFTALTPLGQGGFVLLLLLRFLVGGFESVFFPTVASLNSRWIPRQEYSRAQTVALSGSALGQMVAYPSTAWIIENYSWETVFYFNAALGFAWLTLWLWYSTDTPREHSFGQCGRTARNRGGTGRRADRTRFCPALDNLENVVRDLAVLKLHAVWLCRLDLHPVVSELSRPSTRLSRRCRWGWWA